MKEKINVLNLESKSPTVCLLPYTYVNIFPSGRFSQCCASRIDKASPIENFEELRNSEPFKNVRRNLHSGIEEPSCSACFDLDKSGVVSMRKESFRMRHLRIDGEERFYDPQSGEVAKGPNTVKLALSNLCNLQCRMCTGEFSSRWVDFTEANPEFKRWIARHDEDPARYSRAPQNSNERFPLILKFIAKYRHSIRRFEFLGGEPLINKNHYEVLDVLGEESTNLTLDYSSNLMRLGVGERSVLDSWPRFAGVTLTVSIDGRRELNDYIRIGSRYEVIEKNIKILNEACRNNLWMYAYTTISVYNAEQILDTVKYITELGLLFISNPLVSPARLSTRVLPAQVKQRITANVEKFLSDLPGSLENSFAQHEFWQNADQRGAQIGRVKSRLTDMLKYMNDADLSMRYPVYAEFDQILNAHLKTTTRTGSTDADPAAPRSEL